MNLFDLSSTNANRETYALRSTGGWVGTLPDGYTKMVDGKKFTVHTFDSGTQVLIHKLPDGAVRIRDDGSINWHDGHGELHREYGPASSWRGNVYWYRRGQLHREDGPAIVKADGTKMWYRNNELHREDGPAITQDDGTQEWHYRGQRHREDGPAVVRADGTVEYWLYDKRVKREDLP